MIGKIEKGIAGFYYVHAENDILYECKAKGVFRKDKMKPLVGDQVEIDILDEKKPEGNIIRILPRKNELIRPAVANVDQALVIFAIDDPKPNFALLDRFLISMEQQGISTVICFNKEDLADEKILEEYKEFYRGTGYTVLFTCTRTGKGLDKIGEILKGKTSVVAGPSGVGKSSIINSLQEDIQMETGQISRKLKKGRHTTRHSQVIAIDEDTWILDTPGFSSLFLMDLEADDLKQYFPEFTPYEGNCRFLGCSHTHEPDCAVKAALAEEKISSLRYDNYKMFYQELKDTRKY